MRWRWPVLALALGCPAPGLYMVDLPGEPCTRATRVAYRSMIELGYTVTSAVEATPVSPGKIEGVKTVRGGRETRASVRINCDATGVRMQPVEGALVPSDYEFSRAFGYSVKTLITRPDVETPTEARGLQVLLERLSGPRARVELGGAVLATDAVLVRVTVRNHTDLPVVIDADRIALVTDQGDAVRALRGDALFASLAPGTAAGQVRERLLTRTHVPVGETVQRYLVFPPWSYVQAQVAVEDPETGEADGFLVQIQ